MKNHGWFRILVPGVALLCTARFAEAFVTTGPDDELFATGTASAQYNDNLFFSHSNAKSDTIFDLVPGLEWDFGKNSLNKGDVAVSDDLQLFSSESHLNTNLPAVSLTDAYDDSKTRVNVDAMYQKQDTPTRDVHLVGLLIKRDYYHADGIGELSLTDKSSASAGVIYDNTEYINQGGAKWEWFNVPLKYYYRVEPKLDVSGGFSYQNNTVGAGGVNSDEYFYNLGARGEFTPKLSGQFSVGFEQIHFKRGGTQNGVGIDSGFNFAYSPKTTFTLNIQDGFGYSPLLGESSYRSPGASVGMTSTITDQWKVGALVGYSQFHYLTTAQRDDFYTGQASLTYVLNAYVSFTGAYRYAEDSSNITIDSFKANVFSLAATARY